MHAAERVIRDASGDKISKGRARKTAALKEQDIDKSPLSDGTLFHKELEDSACMDGDKGDKNVTKIAGVDASISTGINCSTTKYSDLHYQKARNVFLRSMKRVANTSKQITINKQQTAEHAIRSASDTKISEVRAPKTDVQKQDRQKSPLSGGTLFLKKLEESSYLDSDKGDKNVNKISGIDASVSITINCSTTKDSNLDYQKTRRVFLRAVKRVANTSKLVNISKQQATGHAIRSASCTNISEEKAHKTVDVQIQDRQKSPLSAGTLFYNKLGDSVSRNDDKGDKKIAGVDASIFVAQNSFTTTISKDSGIDYQETGKVSLSAMRRVANTANKVTISKQNAAEHAIKFASDVKISEERESKTTDGKEQDRQKSPTLFHKKLEGSLRGLKKVVNTAEQVTIIKQKAVERAIKTYFDAKIALEIARKNLDGKEQTRGEFSSSESGTLRHKMVEDSLSGIKSVSNTSGKVSISKQQAIEHAIKVASAAKIAAEMARKNVDDIKKDRHDSLLSGSRTSYHKLLKNSTSDITSAIITTDEVPNTKQQAIKRAIKVASAAKFAAEMARKATDDKGKTWRELAERN